MQKFLSFLIVFIISIFPIVNTSASVSSCQHTTDESMSLSMSAESMSDMDHSSDITSTHDCCDTQKVVCDNENACDCNNSQVSYSAVRSLQITPPQYLGSFKPRFITSLFHSKSSDSLYRPPINTLI